MSRDSSLSIGRGTFYLLTANGLVFVSGYVINFGLGRYLGPELYGTFGVVLALMNIINVIIGSGFPQSAIKFIAEDPAKVKSVIQICNKIQIVVVISIFTIYIALSNSIAKILNDLTITPLLIISAIGIPFYGFYFMVGSYLHGLKRFDKQSIASIAGSISKVFGVFILVFLGFKVAGAILGYMIGTIVGLAFEWKFLGKFETNANNLEWNKIVGFGVPATLFSLLFLLLLNIDLLMVKSLLNNVAEVGYYAAVSTVYKMPYFLFTGLALALFPSISNASARNDISMNSKLISTAIRHMLIFLMPGVIFISATSSDLIALVYSSDFLAAGPPLSIVIFGGGLLALFFVLANVMLADGNPAKLVFIGVPLLIVNTLLNFILVSKFGIIGAAWATTITALLGTVVLSLFVFIRFGAFINARSLIKISGICILIYFVTTQTSLSSVWLPLVYFILFTVYFSLLWLVKELDSSDVNTYLRIVHLDRVFGRKLF